MNTTGAEDTFSGFRLSSYSADGDITKALTQATVVAAISATMQGAAVSIQTLAYAQAFS
ncbi:hypothetical protein [Desulfosediminicola flagellatus]|uniref:hypothetical protein n=1 Tax=Desulfosediminicola flagellatus TaxID=2569541 RepID=UPI0010AC9AB7